MILGKVIPRLTNQGHGLTIRVPGSYFPVVVSWDSALIQHLSDRWHHPAAGQGPGRVCLITKCPVEGGTVFNKYVLRE